MVGYFEITVENFMGTLTSEDKVLSEVKKVIGGIHFNTKRIECAPSWLVQKSIESEHNENCADAYEEVTGKEVPTIPTIFRLLLSSKYRQRRTVRRY